ncbi:hypothetical protein E5352_03995 [Stenotrophomonas maltophilia]|uniref:Uncharacterized protein n=1 Tax=Stenotrophomonas maltophilia TaxID=40324 RepID=A0A4S2D3V2_STEMA|nr:hypothetical protein E5352_03995 [Stenotrophomonas maltophilia]
MQPLQRHRHPTAIGTGLFRGSGRSISLAGPPIVPVSLITGDAVLGEAVFAPGVTLRGPALMPGPAFTFGSQPWPDDRAARLTCPAPSP